MILPDNDTTLVLRRMFAAPRPRVFRAWIEPAALERWLRPRGMQITVRFLEARVGGSFQFDIAGGGAIIGTYLTIIPPEKLAFTWSGRATQSRESVVTLDFLEQGALTEMVLTHSGLSAPDLALVSNGWPSLLDALAGALRFPSDE
jgi:uncharacterized protein YndB with AHSA1/START domain